MLEVINTSYQLAITHGLSRSRSGAQPQSKSAVANYLQIPINNDCTTNSKIFQDLRLGNFPGNFPGSESASSRHVRQTLPPTLTGFPGEAEIKYFVKVTVVRPKFYQENMRTASPSYAYGQPILMII